MKQCSEMDCDAPAKARGLCKRHHRQKLRSGEIELVVHPTECEVDGCDRSIGGGGRGMCPMHYQRVLRDGDPGPVHSLVTPKQEICSFDGCGRPWHAKGYCSGHWNQLDKGRPLSPLKPRYKVVDGMKRCSSCNETKPVSEFHRKHGRPTHNCKRCRSIEIRIATYGIGHTEVLRLMATDRCEACGVHVAGKNHNIDHCHSTGEVRGVLCTGCNSALGMMGDDPTRLRMLASYIERTSPLISGQLRVV